jgi:hypothetical protein
MFPEMDTPVAKHRSLLKKRGFVRVEVQVRSADASLVRKVAKKLTSGPNEERFRSVLKNETSIETEDLKQLLASAPIDGIDLRRSRDTGRKIKL